MSRVSTYKYEVGYLRKPLSIDIVLEVLHTLEGVISVLWVATQSDFGETPYG